MRKKILIPALAVIGLGVGCSGEEPQTQTPGEKIGTVRSADDGSTESIVCPNSAVTGCSASICDNDATRTCTTNSNCQNGGHCIANYNACGTRVIAFTPFDSAGSKYPIDQTVANRGVTPVARRSGL